MYRAAGRLHLVKLPNGPTRGDHTSFRFLPRFRGPEDASLPLDRTFDPLLKCPFAFSTGRSPLAVYSIFLTSVDPFFPRTPTPYLTTQTCGEKVRLHAGLLVGRSRSEQARAFPTRPSEINAG